MLPSEYQQVEYLESTGTQWLDTGYMPNVDTWAEFDYMPFTGKAAGGERMTFGINDHPNQFYFDIYNGLVYYAAAGSSKWHSVSINGYPKLDTRQHVLLDSEHILIDGTAEALPNTTVGVTFSNAVYIFARNENNVAKYITPLRIYSLTFFEQDTPMVELMPCYRISDNKPGMYDLARNVFLTNQGTGEFMTSRAVYPSHERVTTALEMAWRRRALVSKAENRLIPLEYQMVEYLESTGTQWIDTGITPDEGFGFFVDCMPLTNVDTTSASAKILGSSKSDSGHWGGITIGTYAAHNGGQSTWFKNSRNVSLGTYDPGLRSYERVQLENKNNHYTSSTGQSYDTPIHTKNYIYGSLWLFTFHTDIAITTASVRIYSYKAYDGNTTVQNLIPCYRKQDNKPGMYDLISKQFLINQGTGDDFVLGPDV